MHNSFNRIAFSDKKIAASSLEKMGCGKENLLIGVEIDK